MSEGIELRPIGKAKPAVPPRHPEAVSGGSLGHAYKVAEEKAKAAVHLQEGNMDSISYWSLAAAGWFVILAIPLFLFPRILLFFAQTPPPAKMLSAQSRPHLDRNHYDTLTPLESYLCLSLSFGLFGMALLTVFTVLPTYSNAANRHPIQTVRWSALGVITTLVTIMTFISWNNSSIGGLGSVISLGCGVIALWGWWVIAFGQGRSTLANVDKKHHPKRWEKL